MKFSAVIVNYNGADYVVDAVASVLMQDDLAKVIIVDNGSTDDSLPILHSYIDGQKEMHGEDRIKVVELRENTGFANAFNFGLALTDGEVILRLDNDAALFPGAAREALEYFEENPRLGMIAPQVRYSSKPELLNATGMKVFWDASAKDEDLCLSIQQAPREYRETVGPPGCVAFIRREVFDKIGPLDPAFFNYFEDVDFALRAQRAGFFCVHIPEIKAEHYGGGAMVNMPSEWKLEMIHRNQARVLVRNFGTWAYIRGLAIFYFRTLTMWRKAKPEYRAHKKAIRFLWKERKSLREQRRVIRSLGPDKNVDKWINRGWL